MTVERLSIVAARELAVEILCAHSVNHATAVSVADALVAAEIDGQIGHGLSRLSSYAAQAAAGKVDGSATPQVVAERGGGVVIDAMHGFAYPALDLARTELTARAQKFGIAAATIRRSHHCGQAGYQVERLADAGYIGLMFANSPKAIAPWGGQRALFGTNPIAFAAPRRDAAALVIDLSLSKVARGKIMHAAKAGESIPVGWALDAQGQDTTDAAAALEGTMLPMGDAKGAALVLMVEIMAAALSASQFGYEASSFFSAEGEPPGVGQLLLAIDGEFFSQAHFTTRIEELLGAVLLQSGVRLPGAGRAQARKQAQQLGLQISTALKAELLRLRVNCADNVAE